MLGVGDGWVWSERRVRHQRRETARNRLENTDPQFSDVFHRPAEPRLSLDADLLKGYDRALCKVPKAG